MRLLRQNLILFESDERLRRLERQAATDPRAAHRLRRERLRTEKARTAHDLRQEVDRTVHKPLGDEHQEAIANYRKALHLDHPEHAELLKKAVHHAKLSNRKYMRPNTRKWHRKQAQEHRDKAHKLVRDAGHDPTYMAKPHDPSKVTYKDEYPHRPRDHHYRHAMKILRSFNPTHASSDYDHWARKALRNPHLWADWAPGEPTTSVMARGGLFVRQRSPEDTARKTEQANRAAGLLKNHFPNADVVINHRAGVSSVGVRNPHELHPRSV